MALDGFVIHAIVQELQVCIGSRINKIHQPDGHDIVWQMRIGGQTRKLLLSANPTYPRLHFTEDKFLNPIDAPMFCMIMRKHCENGIIESISQVGMERIIRMQIRQRDELGDASSKTLIIELMGRHSNVILVDTATEHILDGIHRITPSLSSHRLVMPGSAYIAPPEQGKLNPLNVSQHDFAAHWHIKERTIPSQDLEEKKIDLFSLPADRRLVQLFDGMSPLVSRELVYRAQSNMSIKEDAQPGSQSVPIEAIVNETDHAGFVQVLAAVFHDWMVQVAQGQLQPTIVEPANHGASFSIQNLLHLEGERQSFASMSACLEAYYGEKAERDTIKQRTADLQKFLQNEVNKNTKKLDKLAQTLAEAKDADHWRISGELLTASMHTIQKGDKEIEVVNYYDEHQATVRIKLDPLLSPSQNSQYYFKKYNKAKNSLIIVQEQIDHTNTEITYLSSILQQLHSASLLDIAEIRDELIDQGYIRNRKKQQLKNKKKAKPVLTSFTSTEGITILVGKNNTQNEYLTNRLAAANETWLHTKDIPGSHVVIRSISFNDETLLQAAHLAAFFSQAKSSSNVAVDYTLIRHVRKPNGAKPGYVIYDNQKTIHVTPDKQWILQLEQGTV